MSWVFLNDLHFGSISKCIFYIKTHKKLLQSFFILAHDKIFVSNFADHNFKQHLTTGYLTKSWFPNSIAI